MAKTSSRVVITTTQMSESRAGADLAEEAETVQPRHLEVGQHEVEATGIAREDVPGRFAVLRGDDLAARLAELRHRELAHDRVVVDGKQPQRLVEDVSVALPGMREQHVGSRLRRGATGAHNVSATGKRA